MDEEKRPELFPENEQSLNPWADREYSREEQDLNPWAEHGTSGTTEEDRTDDLIYCPAADPGQSTGQGTAAGSGPAEEAAPSDGKAQAQWTPSSGKREGEGMGIASLILGILSILSFGICLNYPLGIVAIVLGILQLTRSREKAYAITGIVCGSLGILAGVILAALLVNATGLIGYTILQGIGY